MCVWVAGVGKGQGLGPWHGGVGGVISVSCESRLFV